MDHCLRTVAPGVQFKFRHLVNDFCAQAGYLSEAFEIYAQALALKPDDQVCLLNMGGARQEQGRFREAIAFYEKILEIDPDDTGALNNLGGALMLTGNYFTQSRNLCAFFPASPRSPVQLSYTDQQLFVGQGEKKKR